MLIADDILDSLNLNAPSCQFIQEWLGSRMDRLLARLLAGDALRCYFDTDAISELLARHARGARNQAVLWPVLNFGLWHRYWIEGEPLEPLLEPLGDVT